MSTQSNPLTVDRILNEIKRLQDFWEVEQAEQTLPHRQLSCGSRVLILQELHIWILGEINKDMINAKLVAASHADLSNK